MARTRCHALALRAQLVVVDHLVQPGHARLQRLLAVLVKEELGIGQARAHHALVAANHSAGIFRADVADHQELVGQLACGIEQRKVLLVGLHGQDQALLRHVQKLLSQTRRSARWGARPEPVTSSSKASSSIGSQPGPRRLAAARQLAHDLGTALGKAGDHGTVSAAAWRRSCRHPQSPPATTAASKRWPCVLLPAVRPSTFTGTTAAAVQGHQAVRRAHKIHAAPARQFAIGFQLVAHHLGDRQLGKRGSSSAFCRPTSSVAPLTRLS